MSKILLCVLCIISMSIMSCKSPTSSNNDNGSSNNDNGSSNNDNGSSNTDPDPDPDPSSVDLKNLKVNPSGEYYYSSPDRPYTGNFSFDFDGGTMNGQIKNGELYGRYEMYISGEYYSGSWDDINMNDYL